MQNTEPEVVTVRKSKLDALAAKQKAFALYQKDVAVATIAEHVNVSERMVYRYIEELKLKQALAKLELFNAAVQLMPIPERKVLEKCIAQAKLKAAADTKGS